MEAVLQTYELCKRYRRFTALENVNINVPKGAIYGLVGKNGAGKTTLIRVICGLQEPTAGDYALYGARSGEKALHRARRRMGAVVETPSLYPDMTAEQNLKLQYRVLGLPDEKGIPELLELAGLSRTGKKKAGHFSLGMKQRLGIAVALCGDPDFLVLDEPTNGLDPQGIVEMRELILKLNRERQITVLISSHILSDLEKLCDYIAFLHQGRLLFCDEKDRLLEEYGIFVGTADQVNSLQDGAVVARENSSFGGVRCLVKRALVPAGWALERPTVEDIVLFLVKGAKEQ